MDPANAGNHCVSARNVSQREYGTMETAKKGVSVIFGIATLVLMGVASLPVRADDYSVGLSYGRGGHNHKDVGISLSYRSRGGFGQYDGYRGDYVGDSYGGYYDGGRRYQDHAYNDAHRYQDHRAVEDHRYFDHQQRDYYASPSHQAREEHRYLDHRADEAHRYSDHRARDDHRYYEHGY